MLKEVTLPSGQKVLTFSAPAPSAEASADEAMEATAAGALALDVEGQCPKCGKQMGTAVANGEQVYYCTDCRVCLPLSTTE